MQYSIEHGPAFAWLRVQLAPGESFQAEAGAMVTRSTSVAMKTKLNAGRGAGPFRVLWAFIVALLRKFLAGETMFINEFVAPQGGEVIVAPSLAGQVMQQRLTGNERLFVQAGSYLASTGNVDTKVRFGGLRTLLGGEGLVLLECAGQGDVFANSYGGITAVPVNGKLVVDTGHIVAFDGTLDFRVRGIGGMKSFLFSGEGLVAEFSGRGTVYVQSRNLGALVGWVGPMLPA
jgi:uncharacterized protein (TIGR00266 family)